MISFDEAVKLVGSVARPLGTESVPLSEAGGRILATPVVAQVDSPRCDVSAMDGYAVRDIDLEHFPRSLTVAGEVFAGSCSSAALKPGTCVRIFTGARIPEDADRVLIQEVVRRDGPDAIIDKPAGSERHVRQRGSDFVEGDELLAAGRQLDARALVAAAGADVAQLQVHRRPRIIILGTGDELAEPGTARQRRDAIPESVSFGVTALVQQWGGECIGRTCLRDELPAMEHAARAAADRADLVVVTGGASVGEKDFAKRMFEPLGLELVFSKVSIKPGKPVWLGRAGRMLVMGLPGNPTSALVTARLLLMPLLVALTGRPIERALQWRPMPLASSLKECGPRETFHRARLGSNGAEILAFQDSSAQKALAQADLLVRSRAHSTALEAGAEVEVLDF